MPRTRPPYPPEFRRQAIELIRSGTPLKQVAEELGVSEQTLRNWRRQGDIDAGRRCARWPPRLPYALIGERYAALAHDPWQRLALTEDSDVDLRHGATLSVL